MFALISRSDSTNPSSVPAGWTLLGKQIGTYTWWLYYKLAAVEVGSYTFAWTGPAATKVTIASYRYGFNLNNPIRVVSNTAYIENNAIVRAASMDVGADSSTLLYAASVSYTDAVTFTKPATQDNDWVEDYDEGTALSGFSHTFGHCDWSSMGETGVIDITAALVLTDKHAFAVTLNQAGFSPSDSPSASPSGSASASPSRSPSASPTPSAGAVTIHTDYFLIRMHRRRR